MQLQQLVYFVAVAETRHFTDAARRTHVAQPSLSKQVRLLERELGAELFNRARGNITLTPAGEALLPVAKRILADVESATVEVQELAELRRGRLRLGATPSLSTVLVPPALAEFRATYPGIQLELQESGSRDLVRGLAHGDLDLALIIVPLQQHDPALVTVPLLTEQLVVAVPPDHPLARRRSVRVSELRRHPLVMFRDGYDLRAATLAACRREGFEPLVAVEGGEMDATLRLAAAGLGAAVVPSMVLADQSALRGVPFARPGLERTIALAHRRDIQPARPAREFRRLLVDRIRQDASARRLPPGVSPARARGLRP